MIMNLPDPYPGRCPNLRYGPSVQGQLIPELLRCLDYANKPHVCRFPEPIKLGPTWSEYSSHIVSSPKPWVSPLDAAVEAQP